MAPAYVYGLATVLFWSTVATAFKLALGHLDIFQLIFLACLTSVVVLLTAVVWRGETRSLLVTLKAHPRITLLSAMLNPTAYYLILFAAYDRLPAQVAQPINYTWAIVLTFMSIVFLKQRIRGLDIVAAFICYSGVLIIAAQGQWHLQDIADTTGIALAIASTFIWATYWVINVADPRTPLQAIALNFLVALPLTFGLCVWFSSPFEWPLEGLLAALWVGLFEMGLAFLFWSHALRLATNTSRVSNLIFLSPFLSLVFIHYILGEPLFVTTLPGLAIIIAGLAIQQLRGYERSSRRDLRDDSTA